MNIGIIIGRIGGVDGVALETEKWIDVLKHLGHKVFIISGQFQERAIDRELETLVPEMSFFSPESYWGQKKAFFFPETNPDELIEHISFYSDIICDKIIKWINNRKINAIISENASALPAHLEMGFGIKKAAEKTGIPIITHDHDFAWERGERYFSTHKQINKFVADVFPLRLPNSFHAVINSNAQATLKEKFNRNSVVVPNVMDFNVKFGETNEYNKLVKYHLGLNSTDILLFQITRIVRRKGIEVAIDLIHRLDDKRMKLIITGSHADDEGNIYYNELIEQINKLKLQGQIIFASHIIHNKGIQGVSCTSFSLSDAYANAVACTYFSTYEGFGNAFVESVLSKTPIFVNNYKPVYMPDIGSKGFKTVMLENNELNNKAVNDIREILINERLNKEIADYNFELGKKYFSYKTLEEKLTILFENINKS